MEPHAINLPFADSVKAARAVMEAHIQAVNAHDEAALAATLHFPHYRLSEGVVKIWDTPESYFRNFRERAGDGWHHSTFEEIKLIRASEDKVHLDVRIDRFREDGALLGQFYSFWVISCLNNVWAAQLRSSFAPDSDYCAPS